MSSLQLSNCRGFGSLKFGVSSSSIEKKLQKSNVAMRSSIWGRDLNLWYGEAKGKRKRISGIGSRVFAMSSTEFKMNLNEYMVTLEKPLGIRFAISLDGRIFVHALQKGVFLVSVIFFNCFRIIFL